ncbi:MAG: hemolysin family protein [Chloroflexia bacterium]
MGTDGGLTWLALAGLLLVQALLSAAEVALSSLAGRAELRQRLEHASGSTARLLLRLGEESTRLLTTVRLGSALAGLFSAALVGLELAPDLAAGLALSRAWALILSVLSLAGVLLLLGYLLPRALAVRFPLGVGRLVAWPLYLLTLLFQPPAWLWGILNRLLARLLGGAQPAAPPYGREEEILTLVDAAEEGGAIAVEEKEMISGILEMGRTLVREVMIPRTDIVALDVETPLLEALEVILRAGHSRIPVYQETVDQVVGLLYAKDFLPALRDGRKDLPLRELLRPAYFVPETKVVDDLLRELQHRRIHMAIVVDEYGGTSGLVTIEDLLEEIVGEIQDEYDREEPLLRDLGNGEYLCDARLSVDEAEKRLGLKIPPGEFDTLGGFLYDRLGAIPKVGDQVFVGEDAITVEEVEGVRPIKLRIRHGGPVPPAGASQDPKETQPDE